MIEETISSVLSPLFDGNVFPVIAPTEAALPYCTYLQTGGQGINYLDPVGSDKKWARFQINVWSKSYLESKRLIVKIENLLREKNAYVEGAAISTYSDAHDEIWHGFMQDFTFLT